MRRIDIAQQPQGRDWSRVFMEEHHYDTLFDESVAVYKPDGQPLLILIKKAIPNDVLAQAWPVLKSINSKTDNRSIASGVEQVHRKKLDGTYTKQSKVPKGWEVRSAVIGFFEREARRPFCHACVWNLENPEKFAKVVPMLQAASKHFENHVPDRWAVQKSYCDKTHPDFVIPGTVYTTITVNHNFRTAAHLDAGDLEAGFSNMVYIREGRFDGGHLVLPDWRVAAKLETGDLIMFDAHQWHGNTQIVPLSSNYDRCTVVCYYREKIQHCKSAREEMERVKNRKMGESLV